MKKKTSLKSIAVVLSTIVMLLYSKTGKAEWVFSTPGTAGDVGRYTSLASDGSGNPHISYHDSNHSDLKYVYHDGSGWTTPQTVDSAGDVGEYTSLALDSSDNIHISYFDFTNGDIKYAYLNTDIDNDGMLNWADNCPNTYNPEQEDTLPPSGNSDPAAGFYCGDVCECEGDFEPDGDVDGTDALMFKKISLEKIVLHVVGGLVRFV
jgi:hypothetical protein